MKNRKIIALLVFILSLFLSISYFLFKDFFQQATSLGLLGIFILNFTASATFVPFPAFLTVISGGSIYPPVLVALASSLGAAGGDMVSFAFGLSGRHLVNHKLSKKKWFIVLEKHFKRHGNWLSFIFAFIPNPIFDVVGLVAGIFKYSPLKFFIFVFLGRFLRFFILALFGSKL